MDYTLRCTIFRGFAKKRGMKGRERGTDDSWGWGTYDGGGGDGYSQGWIRVQTGDKQSSRQEINKGPIRISSTTAHCWWKKLQGGVEQEVQEGYRNGREGVQKWQGRGTDKSEGIGTEQEINKRTTSQLKALTAPVLRGLTLRTWHCRWTWMSGPFQWRPWHEIHQWSHKLLQDRGERVVIRFGNGHIILSMTINRVVLQVKPYIFNIQKTKRHSWLGRWMGVVIQRRLIFFLTWFLFHFLLSLRDVGRSFTTNSV